jgi:hypothetical protein
MTYWLSIWLGKKCPPGCVLDIERVETTMAAGDQHMVIADQPIGKLTVTHPGNIEQQILSSTWAEDWMRFRESIVEGYRFTLAHAISDWLRVYMAATMPPMWYLDADARLEWLPIMEPGRAYFAPIPDKKTRVHHAVFYSAGDRKLFENILHKFSNGESVTRASLYHIINRFGNEIGTLPRDCFVHAGDHQ